MTLDAPSHFHFLSRHPPKGFHRNQIQFVQFFHRTVAFLARHRDLDVAVMSEFHKFLRPMNLLPFDGFLLFSFFLHHPDAFELVKVFGEPGMATHTNLKGGHAGHLGLISGRVAVKTRDLILA